MYVTSGNTELATPARQRLNILEFTCGTCQDAESADVSSSDDTSAVAANTSVLSLAEAVGSAFHATLAQSPSGDRETFGNFNLEFSTGTAISDVTSMDDAALNSTYVTAPADTSSGAYHNHPADPLVKKWVILKRYIRQEAARHVHAPAGRVLDENMIETFSRGDFNLPRPSALVRQMNRARQRIRPQEPTTLDFEFSKDYLMDDLLVSDVRVGDDRHLMFATADQLRLMESTRKWYLDGTFRVVNKPFSQLWSVHAFLRQGETIKQVLQKLMDILDVNPVVERFTMDFEAGLWQAIREVFPHSSLHGCGFHWAQALQRRVQEVGLQTTYQRRGMHQHIRKLPSLALPFLPGRNLPRAFKKLRNRTDGTSHPLTELLEYVNDKWLESSLWSPDEWSVYRQTIRTNNDTECWHRRLNGKAGRVALPMYMLMTLLLGEVKLVNIQMQLVTEAAIGRNRRQVYVNVDAKIMDLWDQYDEHEICEDFMKRIGDVHGM